MHRLCELAETDPAYRDLIRRKTLGLPDPPDPRGAEARENLAKMQLVRQCPHYAAPGCGCPDSPAKCSHPDQPDEVFPIHCLTCPILFTLI